MKGWWPFGGRKPERKRPSGPVPWPPALAKLDADLRAMLPRKVIVPMTPDPKQTVPLANLIAYVTHQEAFGSPLPIPAMQDTIRKVDLRSWLYLVARMELNILDRRLMSNEEQSKVVGAFISEADWKVIKPLLSGPHRALFHRHQAMFLLRLVLSTDIPSDAQPLEAIAPSGEVGRLLLGINDQLTDPDALSVVQNPSASEEEQQRGTLNFFLRNNEVYNFEVFKYAQDREQALLIDIPRSLDPAREARLDAAVVAAIGLSVEEFFALGFALLTFSHKARATEKGQTSLFVNPEHFLSTVSLPEERRRAFLHWIVQDLADAMADARRVAPGTKEFLYDMAGLERRPVIRVAPDSAIIVSPRLLVRRFTRGLFALVRGQLLAQPDGKALEGAYVNARSDAAEEFVRLRMADALRPRGQLFPKFPYSGPSGNQRLAEDVIATYGNGGYLFAFEVKSGSVSRLVKTQGTVDELFAPDGHLDRALRQLQERVQDIRDRRLDAPGRELSRFMRIVPVIVTYEPYLQTRLFRERLDAEARRHGLRSDANVAPVALLDFGEIEHAAALQEAGQDVPDLIWKWLHEPPSAEAIDSDFVAYVLRLPGGLGQVTSQAFRVRTEQNLRRTAALLGVRPSPDECAS
jgi:hypothetical protein